MSLYVISLELFWARQRCSLSRLDLFGFWGGHNHCTMICHQYWSWKRNLGWFRTVLLKCCMLPCNPILLNSQELHKLCSTLSHHQIFRQNSLNWASSYIPANSLTSSMLLYWSSNTIVQIFSTFLSVQEVGLNRHFTFF